MKNQSKPELKIIVRQEADLLNAMMIDYLNDFNRYKEKAAITVLNLENHYPYLSSYWSEASRVAYYIIVDGLIIGFSLVNEHITLENSVAKKSIAEFYIIPRFRRQNYGKKAALLILNSEDYGWEIKADLQDNGATSFWTNVCEKYIKNHMHSSYKTCEINQNLIFTIEVIKKL